MKNSIRTVFAWMRFTQGPECFDADLHTTSLSKEGPYGVEFGFAALGLKATFSNAEILQVFLAAPLAPEASCGLMLPPQILPQLRVNFWEGPTVGARIAEACNQDRPTRAPKGDDLVATHEAVEAVHRALTNVVRGVV